MTSEIFRLDLAASFHPNEAIRIQKAVVKRTTVVPLCLRTCRRWISVQSSGFHLWYVIVAHQPACFSIAVGPFFEGVYNNPMKLRNSPIEESSESGGDGRLTQFLEIQCIHKISLCQPVSSTVTKLVSYRHPNQFSNDKILKWMGKKKRTNKLIVIGDLCQPRWRRKCYLVSKHLIKLTQDMTLEKANSMSDLPTKAAVTSR